MGVGKNVVVFMVKCNCTTATIRFLPVPDPSSVISNILGYLFSDGYRELRPDGDRVPGNEVSKVPLKLGRLEEEMEVMIGERGE